MINAWNLLKFIEEDIIKNNYKLTKDTKTIQPTSWSGSGVCFMLADNYAEHIIKFFHLTREELKENNNCIKGFIPLDMDLWKIIYKHNA